jgi:flagellar M-ring protein FliF
LAQAAVGFDASRGDLVTVENLPFEGNQSVASATTPERVLQMAEQSPLLLKYGTLLVGLALLILLGIRPALRTPKAKTAKGEVPAQAALAGDFTASLTPGAPTPVDLERLRAQQVFDHVADQLKQNPAQSSRLLQSWIHSD